VDNRPAPTVASRTGARAQGHHSRPAVSCCPPCLASCEGLVFPFAHAEPPIPPCRHHDVLVSGRQPLDVVPQVMGTAQNRERERAGLQQRPRRSRSKLDAPKLEFSTHAAGRFGANRRGRRIPEKGVGILKRATPPAFTPAGLAPAVPASVRDWGPFMNRRHQGFSHRPP